MFGRLASALWLGLLPSVALAIWSCGGGAQPGPTPPPPVEASPPGVPQNVRVRDRGADFVEWQWDPVSGAAGYQVQVSVGDDDFDPPDEEAVLPANQTAAEFRDPELAPGTVVHLRVRAFAGSAGSPVYGPFSPTVPGLVAGSPATDRMALEAFFAATGGPDWSDNTGWLTPAPLGAWSGVGTDADGRVTALNLSGNLLRGTIPLELAHLTELKTLRLGTLFDLDFGPDNRLHGAIPPALGELTNLEVLDLSGTGVSGRIPTELGQLTNLVLLGLARNALSGPVPAELGQLANLGDLYLGGNELSGLIPAELGQLANLGYLDLGGNELSGLIPAELGQLANLGYLDLGGNELSGMIPAELGQLANLEYLGLGDNELSGSIPPELGQLTKLLYLFIPENSSLSGPIPEELTKLRLLRDVWLPDDVCVPWGPPFDSWVDRIHGFQQWRCPPAGTPAHLLAADRAALEALFRATGGDSWEFNTGWLTTKPVEQWFGVETAAHGRVARLNLSENGLKGRIPSELGQLANLEYLYLGSNELSGSIPAALGRLTDLKRLDLGFKRMERIDPGVPRPTRQPRKPEPRCQRVERPDSARTRPTHESDGAGVVRKPVERLNSARTRPARKPHASEPRLQPVERDDSARTRPARKSVVSALGLKRFAEGSHSRRVPGPQAEIPAHWRHTCLRAGNGGVQLMARPDSLQEPRPHPHLPAVSREPSPRSVCPQTSRSREWLAPLTGHPVVVAGAPIRPAHRGSRLLRVLSPAP